MNMAFRTAGSLATIAYSCEGFAHWSRWIDMNVSISTRNICAIATKEMQTGRNAFW